MKQIGVVTVARSDYGIYLPVLRRLAEESGLAVRLYVSGMHLAPQFGLTVEEVRGDGWEIAEEIEMLMASDTPVAIAKSLSIGIVGFAQAFAKEAPDILLVLGDRFEMYAAVIAALPFKLPIAHIHGGEVTEGAIDESIRHAITKMSHIHFVATEDARSRVVQLGEEPWRVVVSGAPGLDTIRSCELLSRKELEKTCGIAIEVPTILVTYHPATLESKSTEQQVDNLLSAIDSAQVSAIFTYPNADAGHRMIIQKFEAFIDSRQRHAIFRNLGSRVYLSLLGCVSAMVGNSSSGIIEAASFRLPVVNIGNRQRGRLCGDNVIHTGYETDGIGQAITRALSVEFRDSLSDMLNPYGDGCASGRIASTLRDIDVDDRLTVKKFRDLDKVGG